jgi:hypothetical protein
MKLRVLVPIFAVALSVPAFAECTDDVCGSIQKILAARSGNFSTIKGKPGHDPRGDPIWEGTQPIATLTNTCYIYKRGEGSKILSHYEYHCEAPGAGATSTLTPEQVRQIADRLKAAAQMADPKIVWFEDPAARALGDVEDYHGTEGWYGGEAKNNIMLKVETIVSAAVGSSAVVTVFAKPLVRRDLK